MRRSNGPPRKAGVEMVAKIETGLIRKLNVDPDCELKKINSQIDPYDVKVGWILEQRFIPVVYSLDDDEDSMVKGPLDPHIVIIPQHYDSVGTVTLQVSSLISSFKDDPYEVGLILGVDGHLEECRRMRIDRAVDKRSIFDNFVWWLSELILMDPLFKPVSTQLYTLADNCKWGPLATALMREFGRFQASGLATPDWHNRWKKNAPYYYGDNLMHFDIPYKVC